MNWDRVEGQWKQKRGKAVQRWGKVMNDELAAIAGKHEILVGILQEKYGIAKDSADRQVGEFKQLVKELKESNAALMKLQQSAQKAKKRSPRRGSRKPGPPSRKKKTS